MRTKLRVASATNARYHRKAATYALDTPRPGTAHYTVSAAVFPTSYSMAKTLGTFARMISNCKSNCSVTFKRLHLLRNSVL